ALMLTIESTEYRKEALEFAEAELENRGASLAEVAQQISSRTARGKESQPVACLQSVDTSLTSPFARLRTRSLPVWLFLASAGFVFLSHGRCLDIGRGVFFYVTLYVMVAAWICWQCLRRNIDSCRLFGPIPRDPRIWALATLAIPLLALDAGTSWLT